MPKPRVFVSHSAREDTRALTLLDALEARLKAEGFEVLLDRTGLTVGDAWEHKIAAWLDRCHAAIVLFTKKALASDYVKVEVSNLLHRVHRTGPAGTFLLMPVLVEPLTDNELSTFYRRIQLQQIQCLGPDTDAALIQALVEKLEPFKGLALPANADERLHGHVGETVGRNRISQPWGSTSRAPKVVPAAAPS